MYRKPHVWPFWCIRGYNASHKTDPGEVRAGSIHLRIVFYDYLSIVVRTCGLRIYFPSFKSSGVHISRIPGTRAPGGPAGTRLFVVASHSVRTLFYTKMRWQHRLSRFRHIMEDLKTYPSFPSTCRFARPWRRHAIKGRRNAMLLPPARQLRFPAQLLLALTSR